MQAKKYIPSSHKAIYFLTLRMQQPALFDSSICTQHTVTGNNITAVFQEMNDGVYDVILSVSSHKFLLHIKPGRNEIEEFEIKAMR
jgi:hypothetical protein